MDEMIVLIVVVWLFVVAIGHLVYKKLFNHITLYFSLWCLIVGMGEIRLINYYPLETETWMMIVGASISFFIGSLTHALGRKIQNNHNRSISHYSFTDRSVTIIRNAILLLTVCAALSAFSLWAELIAKYGSISKVLLYGNLIYSSRVGDGAAGDLPYVDSFALAASLFAGVYTYNKKKVTIVSVLPLLVVVLVAIAGMGRAKILIALILFLTGFFVPQQSIEVSDYRSKKSAVWKMIFGFAIVLAIVIGSAEIVRSNRGMVESFSGSTKTLNKLRGGALITPSIYVYFSIHPFVFNEYLKGPGEPGWIGANTFAPLWRILDKFGTDTYVSNYQIHYRTPAGSNTGTYLRELHSDFGLSGVIVIPYILGFISSLYWYRWTRVRRILDLVVLAHLYVIIALSYLTIATRLGYWLVSLIAAGVVAVVIDRSQDRLIKQE